MSESPDTHGMWRARFQGWLQTVVFLGVLAILAVVVYSSYLVQANRRAREVAATAAPRTATAQELASRRGTPLPEVVEAISEANAARVTGLSRWGQGGVLAVAWSPDGRWLAVGTTIGVRLYDGVTWSEVRSWTTPAPALYVAFSPDSQTLAAGLYDGTVWRWRVADGAEVAVWRDFRGPIRAVAFAPGGALLVAGQGRAGSIVWIWQDGRDRILDWPEGVDTPRPADPLAMAISGDGRFIAIGGSAGTVSVWRLANGGFVRQHRGGMDVTGSTQVGGLAFSPNGQALAYLLGGWVRLWWIDGDSEQNMFTYGASLAFSPDGNLLAGGAQDGTLVLWQTAAPPGNLQRTITSNPYDYYESISISYDDLGSPVMGLAFSPDGALLAGIRPRDGSVVIWSGNGKYRQALPGGAGWLGGAAFSPDGKTVAVGGLDGTAWLWGAADARPQRAMAAQGQGMFRPLLAFLSLAFAPDGQVLATGAAGGPAYLWGLPDGTLLYTLTVGAGDGSGHSPEAYRWSWGTRDGTLRYSVTVNLEGEPGLAPDTYRRREMFTTADGQLFVVEISGYSVLVGRLGEADLLRSLMGIAEPATTAMGPRYAGEPERGRADVVDGLLLPGVTGLSFSPDGQLLAVASGDGTVRLWRVGDGALQQTLNGSAGAVHSVAFSPDGHLLAAGADDATIYLWSVPDGRLERTLTGHTGPVTGVAFSPGGEALASSSRDGTLRLWQVAGGAQLRVVMAGSALLRVAFSPDGRLLAAGAADGTVRLWRAGDGEPLAVLRGHTLPVLSVAFSPDGTLLMSTSQDGTVRLWGIAR